LQDLTPELTDALDLLPGRGVVVSGVEPNSPAAEVGLERGFVIYRLGRREVNSVRAIETLLGRAQRGSQVDFLVGIVRSDGRSQLQSVPLTAR